MLMSLTDSEGRPKLRCRNQPDQSTYSDTAGKEREGTDIHAGVGARHATPKGICNAGINLDSITITIF